MLSVIIPAYNEELMIPKAVDAIGAVLRDGDIPYELVFVDDGSNDGSWDAIVCAASQDSRVRGVGFSRNFGKEAAIMGGLGAAKGDCCAVIDCDLQHPPETLVEMYRLWEQGYQVVEGIKADRGSESGLHRAAAKGFYSIISKVTGYDMANTSDFKLLDRSAVNVLLNIRERNSFFRAMSSWIGFRTASVQFEVREREAGESKWSTAGLIKYAFRNITAFSSLPMQIVTVLGCLMLIIAVAFGSIALWQKLSGVALEGFTTVILIQLLSSSFVMISIGIIGYYISCIYEEVKGRPKYVVAQTTEGESDEGAN